MKVIYNGLKEKEEMLYELHCIHCNSVFECNDKELGTINRDDRDGDYYTINCPVCNKMLYINDSIVVDKRNNHTLVRRKK